MVTDTSVKKSQTFEKSSVPTPEGTTSFFLDEWDSVRSEGIAPKYVSKLTDDNELRDEFLAGAEMLGLVGRRKTLKPQQLYLADALQAGPKRFAVCMPRRATKTTTILAVLIGRCLRRPDVTGEPYTVMFSAQSGIKSTARFREWITTLDRVWADEETRPFKARLAAGSQALLFPNGSAIYVVQPSPESYRGDAANVVWLDEAQAHDADFSKLLLAGVTPTMLTVQDRQFIVSGTAGPSRSGLLWDFLEEGRSSDKPTGIVEYAAPDGTDFEDISKPEVWLASHPGIDEPGKNLATVEDMQEQFDSMSAPEFAAEFLGMWPEDYTSSAISPALWNDAVSDRIDIPQNVAFGFDIAPDGSSACLAAAWRVDGVAYIEILAHEQGSAWLNKRVQTVGRKYKAITAYDRIGTNAGAADEMDRLRPKPKLQAIDTTALGAANAVFSRDLEGGSLKHFDQPGMTAAALGAVRRPMGTRGAWAWNWTASRADLTPLRAATLALRVYDHGSAPRTAMKPSIAS